MRKLRDITTRLSLADIVEAWNTTISTTEVQPEPRPEGEKKFVAVHTTEKHPDRAGNKGDVRNGEKQKHYTFKEKPKAGFPPEVKEEEEIDEGIVKTVKKFVQRGFSTQKGTAARKGEDAKYWGNYLKNSPHEMPRNKKGELKNQFDKDYLKKLDRKAGKYKKFAEETDKEEGEWGVDELGRFRRVDEGRFKKPVKRSPYPYRISEPKKTSLAGVKTDPKGNVILSKRQKLDVEHLPRSRKLTGRPYKPVKEEKEIDEGDPIHSSGRRSKTRQARQKAGPNFPEKKGTVLVTNKGSSEALRGGGVRRIPKAKYNPNVHNLAEDELDELSVYKMQGSYKAAGKAVDKGFQKAARHRALGQTKAATKASDKAIKHQVYGTERVGEVIKKRTGTYEPGTVHKVADWVSQKLKGRNLTQKKRVLKDETELDEKWGVKDAVNPAEKGKYAGWTLEKLKAAKSKPGADQKELNFAIRAKTGWGKVKEETELDEISGYMRNAREIIASRARESEKAKSDYQKKRQRPYGGTSKAAAATTKDLEDINKTRKEETQLDELSTDTLKSYKRKAVKSFKRHGAIGDALLKAAGPGSRGAAWEYDKQGKRLQGIQKAHQRLKGTFTPKGPVKYHAEETEQLDELGRETLRSYTRGAAKSMKSSAYKLATGTPHVEKPLRNVEKRGQGIERAQDRLGGTFQTGKPLRVMIPGKGPNDKASGPYTMKRRKMYWDTQPKIGEETELDEGGPTKKHFQMAADTIKSIPDEAKRKEHAHAHADLYTKQNPRFDRGKFLKAAGVNEETDKDRYLNKSYKHSRDAEKKRQLRGDMRASNDAYREKIHKARTAQLRKEETIDEVSAPGEETWIKHRKKEGGFQSRYGDRWKNVLYATAWKRSKHNYPKG